MADPLVSTIIPTFNRAELLPGAIDSVRRQTYAHVEIIVVDDGSTDQTAEILEGFGGSIRVVRQSNAGPAAARNRGIAEARGEIISFLDSDDAWHPTKLARQVRLLQRTSAAVPACLSNAWMVYPDGRRQSTFEYAGLRPACSEGIWRNVAEVLATRFVLFAQTVAIRREIIERIGGFDCTLRYLEDYEFPLRLALEGPWAFIGEPMVTWQQESPSSYAAQANANQMLLHECSVQMRETLWARVKQDETHRALRGPFRRELTRARRVLKATKLEFGGSQPEVLASKVISGVERVRAALQRRSPWYPRMEVHPLP